MSIIKTTRHGQQQQAQTQTDHTQQHQQHQKGLEEEG
jgi:hypothetical protein